MAKSACAGVFRFDVSCRHFGSVSRDSDAGGRKKCPTRAPPWKRSGGGCKSRSCGLVLSCGGAEVLRARAANLAAKERTVVPPDREAGNHIGWAAHRRSSECLVRGGTSHSF